MTDLDATAARAAEDHLTADARAPDLAPLFAPSSLAIVGASERPGTIGHTLTETLAGLKFAGPIWPINPRHTELYGLRCYASVADLPGAPDMVVFGIKGSAAVDELEVLGALGARAAVIYDNGFAEAGEAGAALQARLVATCRRYGIALCGPNCMGTIGAHDGFSSYRLAITEPERFRGGVGLISHSGSITIGLLADVRRYGFSKVVSAGNEAVADAADYIQHFIDDPYTRSIACFLETVRRPAAFRAALSRAAEADKPVVILKVGRSARAGYAIVTHTGGLAGEAQVFSDVLWRLNAIEVADLVEMSEVLAALDGPRRPRGGRIAVATGSGGQAELLLDVADAAGLSLPPLDRESIAEVERVVGPITGDGNPLDCWGNGDVRTNLAHSLDLLGRHPGYDAVALCNEQSDGAPIRMPDTTITVLGEAGRKSDKPFYCLNLRAGMMRTQNIDRLRADGVITLGGARQGLLAIDRVGRYEQRRRQAVEAALAPPAGNPLAAERRRVINEFDAKRLLAPFGVPVPPEQLVHSADEACAAAERIGWPIVLKAVSDQIAHKTELGLVRLDLRDRGELVAAWEQMSERLRTAAPDATLAGWLVQPMIRDGIEVFLGLRRDPDWGLALAFGLGGIFLEVMRDVALRTLPLEPGDAREMIHETKAAHVLAGVRGAPPADLEALAKCIEALADFGRSGADDLVECDLNPVKVFPRGCLVLDALIVLDRS
jgi:acetate---CoA ligase (ADP-forming)